MPFNLGTRKHVFIDWDLIEPGYGVAWSGEHAVSWESPSGVRLTVHPPHAISPPIVCADRPWESALNVYATLMKADGASGGALYRLYYESHYFHRREEPREDEPGMLACAESRDGVTWTKPIVGSVSFNGSVENNLVFGRELSLGRGGHGATVFLDPAAPPQERYKLVNSGREGEQFCVFGAVSPDGLRWQPLRRPLLAGYKSDTQTVMAFDAARGKYVGYFRGWLGYERGTWQGRRTIAYAESDDFGSWPVPETILAPDASDHPDTDIYTNGYTRWPGVVDAHLMFPALYERSADVLEVHMMTSRDGVHWQRPLRRPIIGRGEPGSGWEGGVYAGCGIIALPSGEWALPIGPKWHTHNQLRFVAGQMQEPPDRGHLRLAHWRPDGFMSLEALGDGHCSTVPLTFAGSQLRVNAWTQFGGEITFELARATGEPLPGFTFAQCDPVTGDAPDHSVSWQGQRDISAFAGAELRLRLRLRRARLYALQFAPGE